MQVRARSIRSPILSEADWGRIIDINPKGVFLGAKATLRGMKASGDAGAIVNIGPVEAYGTIGGNALIRAKAGS